ncbi:MAG: hypothetical protein HZC24_07450 [Rhodocyclales bacterium]|nr:hypothetical protein [Rhodocyclales bacterium]
MRRHCGLSRPARQALPTLPTHPALPLIVAFNALTLWLLDVAAVLHPAVAAGIVLNTM